MIPGNGLFVTATDTGVGKTVVTAGLVRSLRKKGFRIGVMKPMQSGHLRTDPEGDGMRLKNWTESQTPIDRIVPYSWSLPVAPGLAAYLAGESVDIDWLLQEIHMMVQINDGLLIEGAGGWLVPIGNGWTIADFAAAIGWPTLVVARPGLGTVNHTALTVAAIRQRGLSVTGVVINGSKPEDPSPDLPYNAQLIEEVADVPVLGTIPWLGDTWSPKELEETILSHLNLTPILHLWNRKEEIAHDHLGTSDPTSS